jgi:hypothetical protein
MDSKDESEFWDLVHDYINAPTMAAERLIAWVDAKIERREPARASGKTKDPEGIISIQIRTDHFLLADFFIDILRRGDITFAYDFHFDKHDEDVLTLRNTRARWWLHLSRVEHPCWLSKGIAAVLIEDDPEYFKSLNWMSRPDHRISRVEE